MTHRVPAIRHAPLRQHQCMGRRIVYMLALLSLTALLLLWLAAALGLLTHEQTFYSRNGTFLYGHKWTGFYVGGQAGVAFNYDSGPFSSTGSSFVGGGNDGETGFIGGVHVGYDQQINNLIVGVVADINYIDAESFTSFTLPNSAAMPYAMGAVTRAISCSIRTYVSALSSPVRTCPLSMQKPAPSVALSFCRR